jgi:hypothetical protein
MASPSPRTSRPPVDPNVARRGAVYGIPTLAVDAAGMPIPGVIVVGYVGKTRQTVKQREDQHRACQSFGDLIVGGSWVIEEGFWTEAELNEREQYYIRNGVALVPGGVPQRPVYNYDHNLDNPNRIEVWRAREHRQARQPGWQPVVKVPRQRGARPALVVKSRSRLARWWQRRRWWAAGLGSAWTTLFAAVLWMVLPTKQGTDAVASAAFWATLPFAFVQGEIWRRRVRAWWRRTTRPRRRRRRR